MQRLMKLGVIIGSLLPIILNTKVLAETSNFGNLLEHPDWVMSAATRKMTAYGMPDNAYTGTNGNIPPAQFFPNSYNLSVLAPTPPLNLTANVRTFGVVPAAAKFGYINPLNMIPFGVAVDGVLFDPSGPWYSQTRANSSNPPPFPTPVDIPAGMDPNSRVVKGFDPTNAFDADCSGWEYEVMSPFASKNVGLDPYNAHLQPGPSMQPNEPGRYHYHGFPWALDKKIREDALRSGIQPDAFILGYAADGHPMIEYEALGRSNDPSDDVVYVSGYVLRTGARWNVTGSGKYPDGNFDGTFVQDYEFNPTKKLQLIKDWLAKNPTKPYLGIVTPQDVINYDLAAQGKPVAGRRLVILDGANAHYPPGGKLPYSYVLTPEFPYIPRGWREWPDKSFIDIMPNRSKLYACPGNLHNPGPKI